MTEGGNAPAREMAASPARGNPCGGRQNSAYSRRSTNRGPRATPGARGLFCDAHHHVRTARIRPDALCPITIPVVATLLLKTEPSEYSFDDLVRDKRTVWSGVSNPQALAAIRAARKGDEAFMYHTGDEKRIVGLAQIISDPYADPEADDPKFAVFDLKPLRAVKTPVTLAQIKADARFAAFALVKNSRLSVMPVPADLDKILRKLAGL